MVCRWQEKKKKKKILASVTKSNLEFPIKEESFHSTPAFICLIQKSGR